MNFYYSLSNTNEVREVINLAVFVLTIVASWILYNKAGEPGWAAIIPFYSSYIRFKVAGKKKLFWGYFAASIVTIASFILLCYELVVSGMFMFASAYSRSYYDSMYGYSSSLSTHMAMMIFSVVIFFSALIVMVVLNIMCCIGLSRAFGKGAGFACGLIFLNVVFLCIMAFNRNIRYVGNGGYNNNYYNPYGQNMYNQNMYGASGTNGAGNQQYGQNMYGTPGTNGAGNQQYGQNDYDATQILSGKNPSASSGQSWNDEYSNKDYE